MSVRLGVVVGLVFGLICAQENRNPRPPCGKPDASGILGAPMGAPELKEGGWALCCQCGELSPLHFPQRGNDNNVYHTPATQGLK